MMADMTEWTKFQRDDAFVIKANGEWLMLPPPHDGETYTSKELHAAVGGWIQVVPLPKDMRSPFVIGRVFLCDEEGLLKKLPVNLTASLLLGQSVCGPVVGLPKEMLE